MEDSMLSGAECLESFVPRAAEVMPVEPFVFVLTLMLSGLESIRPTML